ncbi:hypothetical protein FSPOR_29 [Fusarium sporotrichioides]|uniref:Uncharacterized protein n=1 Tax=Fusarium sporotrichioides TaxID=5514 RepID=A0A395SVU4_FUSSP|nr:hypothetical protein FSPOR_29 [Fusarium sporotrichioides]
MAPRSRGSPWPNFVFLPLTASLAPCYTNFKDKRKNKIHQPCCQFDSIVLTSPHLASSRLASTEQVPTVTVTVKARSGIITVGWFSAALQISLVQVNFGLQGRLISTSFHGLHPRLAQRQPEILLAVEHSVMSPSLAGL